MNFPLFKKKKIIVTLALCERETEDSGEAEEVSGVSDEMKMFHATLLIPGEGANSFSF